MNEYKPKLPYPHNKENIPKARELRKNMTPQERLLWYAFLKDYPIRFQRQKIFGPFILDFYCPKCKLVIEIDGSQHYFEEGKANDEKRTAYLEQYGLKVIRVANNEISANLSGVCAYIDFVVQQSLGE